MREQNDVMSVEASALTFHIITSAHSLLMEPGYTAKYAVNKAGN